MSAPPGIYGNVTPAIGLRRLFTGYWLTFGATHPNPPLDPANGTHAVDRIRQVVAETEAIDPLLLLTDKYPNRYAFERAAADPSGRVVYRSEPVDATDMPTEL